MTTLPGQPGASAPPTAVLGSRAMPGADWFPGARLNYAQHVLRRERPGEHALFYQSETAPLTGLPWPDLAGGVRVLATRLRALGVRPGDRVASCMPNTPQTVIAMLATTSIGAVWTGCSPDFGWRGVSDRFGQLSPRVLFCVDSYRYGGRDHDRSAAMEQIIALLVAQGDFFKVNERGGCFVLGRSDATLNRTQWRYTLGRMSVEIPTGGSQSSDHGVLAAAKRELREETGLSAGYWRELGFIDNSNGTTTDVAHMFLATGLEAGTDAQDAEERIVLSWLPFGQAVEKVLDGSITESVSVAAILKANLLLRRER